MSGRRVRGGSRGGLAVVRGSCRDGGRLLTAPPTLVRVVLDAPDPLKKLRDLAQDFPSHASALSTVKVDEDLRQGAAYARQFALQGGLGSRALLFLGGAAHDLSSPTLSVHAMLKAVRDEVRSLRDLDALQLQDSDALLKLAHVRRSERRGGAVKRVDLLSGSKGAVTYANNLEKDAMY